jgi:hypothetical protein
MTDPITGNFNTRGSELLPFSAALQAPGELASTMASAFDGLKVEGQTLENAPGSNLA